MKSIGVLLGLFTIATVDAEVMLPRLPGLYIFRYVRSRRDPFIAATASRTIISGNTTDLAGESSGRAVRQYLQTMIQAIKRELFVQGVSTGENNAGGVALINGVAFGQGEKIPLSISGTEMNQLEELAKSYGLPLAKPEGNEGKILVEVGTVLDSGVSIVLPGFKTALCTLTYTGDRIPEKIILERKTNQRDE